MATPTDTKRRKIVELSETDMKQLVENSVSENTKELTKQSVNMLKEYLRLKEMDEEVEKYEPGLLDQTLGQFYAEIRDKDGNMYKKTTLMSYRLGLQRFLQSVRGDKIDIVKGADFVESSRVFGGMVKEMKRQGLGAVDHHPPISEADLEVLYAYLDSWRSTDSAQILQHKVFVDLMIHFGRRGRENLRSLQRDDFAVTRDGEGSLYVYKTKDVLTKTTKQMTLKQKGGCMKLKEASDAQSAALWNTLEDLTRIV